MADADVFLTCRMKAHEARVSIADIREGGCHDVLVRVHLREAERYDKMAADELLRMSAEATEAGKPVRFPLQAGWAIVAEPA